MIQSELDQLGDRVTVEQGSRHIKIMVDGRLATIYPVNGGTESSQRAVLNVRASIRRAAEGRFARC